AVRKAKDTRAGIQQLLKQLRIVRAQQRRESPKKHMAVAELRCAAALPVLEGFFRTSFRCCRIAIDQRDAIIAVAERQCRAKARYPGSGDKNALTAHALLRHAARASVTQPARNDTPPTGVTKANTRSPVSASAYNDPENRTIPARNRLADHVAVRAAFPCIASAASPIASA